MSSTIRFQRPETPHGVSKMFVPTEANTTAQVRHLERLGYTIVDVSPSLTDPGCESVGEFNADRRANQWK